jgi:YVTN family beta-propeller protein
VLRKLLPDGALETRGRGYRLNVEEEQLDLDRFRRLRGEGRVLFDGGDAAEASERLRLALSLWRGEALADCRTDSFAAAELAALDKLRSSALEERIEADLAAGRHAEVVGELEALVVQHPYHERFWEQLMLARYRCGRTADALAAYRDARRILDEDLGLEPGPTMRGLERAILAHDPALDPPAPRAAAAEPEPPSKPRRRIYLAAALVGVVTAAVAIPILALGQSGASSGSARVGPNAVAVVNPSGRVVGSAPAGVRPGAVAVGAGAVWVANQDDRTLSRLDPKTLALVKTIALGSTPTGLAVGAGAVWVASGLVGTLTRVDPGTDTVAATIPVAPRTDDSSVTVGSGRVWTASGDGNVSAVAPATNHVAVHGVAGFSPSAIAVGGGRVWVANVEDNNISVMDPRTGTVIRTITVGRRPSALAAGDGSIWVADAGDDSVTRIDAASMSVEDTFRVGTQPLAIAYGAGAVWVANAGAGTISRIDPSSGSVKTIAVANRPAAIAFGDGLVWVAVQAAT